MYVPESGQSVFEFIDGWAIVRESRSNLDWATEEAVIQAELQQLLVIKS